MGQPQTITMRAFRGMDSLSGNLRVEGGSRQRKGVRRLTGRASCNSPEELAGSDAESGLTAGGDAHTSAALTAGHKTDADPAKTKAKEAGGTPKKEEKKAITGAGGGDDILESLWNERATLPGGEELPLDGMAFADAVNKRIDIVRLTELLLRGRDERSSKSALEQLLEMKYGKNARVAEAGGPDGEPTYIIDIPSAVAQRALDALEKEKEKQK